MVTIGLLNIFQHLVNSSNTMNSNTVLIPEACFILLLTNPAQILYKILATTMRNCSV